MTLFIDDEFNFRWKNVFKYIGIPIICIILFFVFNPFYTVSSTERGLKFTWGAIQNEVIEPGLHVKVPIAQRIEKISILPIETVLSIPVGEDGAITKDNQTVGVELVSFFRYDESQLVEMYRSLGEKKALSVINTAIKESVKNVIGTYTIFTIAENQGQIVRETTNVLREKLNSYPLTITEVRILNWDWSDDYDEQIKVTMQRAQQVKQKEQELLIAQTEAQKSVALAEAEKRVAIERAEGDKLSRIAKAQAEFESAKLMADARAEEGRGEREYNNSIAGTLNIQIKLKELDIEKERVKKWNGVYVPTNNYGPIPIASGSVFGK